MDNNKDRYLRCPTPEEIRNQIRIAKASKAPSYDEISQISHQVSCDGSDQHSECQVLTALLSFKMEERRWNVPLKLPANQPPTIPEQDDRKKYSNQARRRNEVSGKKQILTLVASFLSDRLSLRLRIRNDFSDYKDMDVPHVAVLSLVLFSISRHFEAC